MDFLIFQLYGPMAAWGEIAVGDHRPSAAYPSKSAILGLLAAALGIRRDQDDEHRQLAESYGFAVRVDAIGDLLRDYHTIQVPHAQRGARYYTRQDELAAEKLDTILSQRDYRTDAYCLVALWSRNTPPYSLEQLSEHLRQPRFTLYLGRKSCPPARPLAPQVITTHCLREAFEGYKTSDSPVRCDPQQRYYWEELSTAEAGMKADMSHPRRDMPTSRVRWQFADRDEFFALQTLEEGSA